MLSDFHRTLETLRIDDLEAFLHPEIRYSATGFRAVEERRTVIGYWRRLFSALSSLNISVSRQVRDGDLIVLAETTTFAFRGRSNVVLEGVTVYELEEGRIRLWHDGRDASRLDRETRALWTRLRRARW